MRTFEVLTKITLGYGSHTRRHTPAEYKEFSPGNLLRLDDEADNGNVWFIDENGDRGKIECGEVANLVRRGVVKEIR